MDNPPPPPPFFRKKKTKRKKTIFRLKIGWIILHPPSSYVLEGGEEKEDAEKEEEKERRKREIKKDIIWDKKQEITDNYKEVLDFYITISLHSYPTRYYCDLLFDLLNHVKSGVKEKDKDFFNKQIEKLFYLLMAKIDHGKDISHIYRTFKDDKIFFEKIRETFVDEDIRFSLLIEYYSVMCEDREIFSIFNHTKIMKLFGMVEDVNVAKYCFEVASDIRFEETIKNLPINIAPENIEKAKENCKCCGAKQPHSIKVILRGCCGGEMCLSCLERKRRIKEDYCPYCREPLARTLSPKKIEMEEKEEKEIKEEKEKYIDTAKMYLLFPKHFLGQKGAQKKLVSFLKDFQSGKFQIKLNIE